MSWWRSLFKSGNLKTMSIDPQQLSMPGWEIVNRVPLATYWRDAMGDVVSLTLSSVGRGFPALSQTDDLRAYCRGIAESQGAGLVEVAATVGAEGPSLTYIYKRLKIPAFTFYGVVDIPIVQARWIWMIIASEHGTTGVREAVVAAKLAEAGRLTIESYQASWAQDPYDPSYRGVNHSTLRYVSDAEEYDAEFPNHPLTKVRREINRLLRLSLSSGAA